MTFRTNVLNEMWDTVGVIGHGKHKCSQPLFSHCWSRYTQVQPTFVPSVLVTAHTSAASLFSLTVGHGTHKCTQPLFCQCWSRHTQVQPTFVLSVLVTVHKVQPTFVLSVLVTICRNYRQMWTGALFNFGREGNLCKSVMEVQKHYA